MHANEDWVCGSSGKATAYRVYGPKFKPQYHNKTTRVQIENHFNSQEQGIQLVNYKYIYIFVIRVFLFICI
jgi:hypothetical protein